MTFAVPFSPASGVGGPLSLRSLKTLPEIVFAPPGLIKTFSDSVLFAVTVSAVTEVTVAVLSIIPETSPLTLRIISTGDIEVLLFSAVETRIKLQLKVRVPGA